MPPYCGVIDIVPRAATHDWLAILLKVPERVVVCVAKEPCTEMTVPDVASLIVILKVLPLVLAFAVNVLPLMHMLLGIATEPL